MSPPIVEFLSVSNILVHIPLGANGYDLSWVEAIGTAFCLPCALLAARERVENYAFGLVNVTCFAIIFYQVQLYASLFLQVFFFVANIYGWYEWTRHDRTGHAEFVARWLPRPALIRLSLVSLAAILIVAATIDTWFAAASALAAAFGAPRPSTILADPYPLWDSAVLVLQVVAMILMARKYVESWILWSATYALGVALYAAQGIMVMAIENVVLTLIALSGTRHWIRSAAMQRQAVPVPSAAAVRSLAE